jgi:hypothetical protein
VTVADFYLRDGTPVSGRLIQQDNNQVIIEQPKGSTLVTISFSKRDIDTRTLKTRKVMEYAYYRDMAQYFAAQTWDFRDDPDDFIQAIRCYEKAKLSLEESDREEPERLAEVNDAIAELKADREVWEREMASRAELKSLEFEAEAEKRMKAIEQAHAEAQIRFEESMKYFEATVASIKDDTGRISDSVNQLTADYNTHVRQATVAIADLQRAVNDLYLAGASVIIGPTPK